MDISTEEPIPKKIHIISKNKDTNSANIQYNSYIEQQNEYVNIVLCDLYNVETNVDWIISYISYKQFNIDNLDNINIVMLEYNKKMIESLNYFFNKKNNKKKWVCYSSDLKLKHDDNIKHIKHIKHINNVKRINTIDILFSNTNDYNIHMLIVKLSLTKMHDTSLLISVINNYEASTLFIQICRMVYVKTYIYAIGNIYYLVCYGIKNIIHKTVYKQILNHDFNSEHMDISMCEKIKKIPDTDIDILLKSLFI